MSEILLERIERELKEIDAQIHRYFYIGWNDQHLQEWRHFLLEGLLNEQLKNFDKVEHA